MVLVRISSAVVAAAAAAAAAAVGLVAGTGCGGGRMIPAKL